MALSLSTHIVVAALGVGMPVLMLAAEARWLATRDPAWKSLARRWSEVFAVLFAVGAVTGTVLSFEIALLWPRWVGAFGSVVGLPFTLEAFAFFLEAIFLGIYLYGWDRVSPRAHFASGVPVAVAGLASLAFVVTANSWMNVPRGFDLVGGRVVDARPLEAMTNPASFPQVVHMALAAYVVTGFLVAGVHAASVLRGRDDVARRRGIALAAGTAALLVPAQALVGHWSATVVAATQPVKLAAMEGQWKTEARAPLRLGGWPDEEDEVTRGAIEIPGGLSFLGYADPSATVRGLSEVPRRDRPPVRIVHVAFQAMVAAGTALLALSAWVGASWLRRRRSPSSRAFLRSLVAAAVLSVVALEAGWVVTEVGRQPWIVQGVMRVEDAFTDAPGTRAFLWISVAVFAALAWFSVRVLRRVAARTHEGGHGA
jgi:cytochrome d ubiquinol oxidase subunit I